MRKTLDQKQSKKTYYFVELPRVSEVLRTYI